MIYSSTLFLEFSCTCEFFISVFETDYQNQPSMRKRINMIFNLCQFYNFKLIKSSIVSIVKKGKH